MFLRLIGRELTLAVRGGIGSLMAVVFFVIAVTLFPLGIGPELGLLSRIAPGAVLGSQALLAALLSLDRLFVAEPRGRKAWSSSCSARCRWSSSCWPRPRPIG